MEATFIMILTFGVIIAVIYGGFFLHDRCLLSGMAYENAVRTAWEQRMGSETREETEETELRKRAWFYRNGKYSTEVGETEITVQIQAEENLPAIGVLQNVLHAGSWQDGAEMKCTCIETESIIRKCRVVMELMDGEQD